MFRNASGFGGLENTPLARPYYYRNFIDRGWEKDFIQEIANTSILEPLTGCNQSIQFMKQPMPTPWRRYDNNQLLVPETIVPEGMCVALCHRAYKAYKFDKVQIRHLCERFDAFESSLLDATYQVLAKEWRCQLLTGMAYESSKQNKGANAGADCNINLGTRAAPLQITGANIADSIARLRVVLEQSNQWIEGQMFIVLPSVARLAISNSPYASALEMGSCVDCSTLVTGKLPGQMHGFNVYMTDRLWSEFDNGRLTYAVVAGNRNAYAFIGDIVEGEIENLQLTFGIVYKMLAEWGGAAIQPEALAVAHMSFSV